MEHIESENFDKCVAFIQAIGIPILFKNIEKDCFLPGLSIENGCIIVDRQKLLYPGDILHEAGHIAVVPSNERQTLNEESIDNRKDNAAEEMMAIAWSFAACVHLQLDVYFVFHENGYKGGARHIADNFKQGNYFGVPMLQWVGMTFERKNETEPEKPIYPEMLHWLRN